MRRHEERKSKSKRARELQSERARERESYRARERESERATERESERARERESERERKGKRKNLSSVFCGYVGKRGGEGTHCWSFVDTIPQRMRVKEKE